jgi:hypothetical protein
MRSLRDRLVARDRTVERSRACSSTADPRVVTIAVAGMISASGGSFSWTGASERYDQAIGENSSVHTGADAATDGSALQPAVAF